MVLGAIFLHLRNEHSKQSRKYNIYSTTKWFESISICWNVQHVVLLYCWRYSCDDNSKYLLSLSDHIYFKSSFEFTCVINGIIFNLNLFILHRFRFNNSENKIISNMRCCKKMKNYGRQYARDSPFEMYTYTCHTTKWRATNYAGSTNSFAKYRFDVWLLSSQCIHCGGHKKLIRWSETLGLLHVIAVCNAFSRLHTWIWCFWLWIIRLGL